MSFFLWSISELRYIFTVDMATQTAIKVKSGVLLVTQLEVGLRHFKLKNTFIEKERDSKKSFYRVVLFSNKPF